MNTGKVDARAFPSLCSRQGVLPLSRTTIIQDMVFNQEKFISHSSALAGVAFLVSTTLLLLISVGITVSDDFLRAFYAIGDLSGSDLSVLFVKWPLLAALCTIGWLTRNRWAFLAGFVLTFFLFVFGVVGMPWGVIIGLALVGTLMGVLELARGREESLGDSAAPAWIVIPIGILWTVYLGFGVSEALYWQLLLGNSVIGDYSVWLTALEVLMFVSAFFVRYFFNTLSGVLVFVVVNLEVLQLVNMAHFTAPLGMILLLGMLLLQAAGAICWVIRFDRAKSEESQLS